MARKSNVKNIKKYIDDVLGAKTSLRERLPSKQDRLREIFCEALRNLQFVNSRTLGMKHDYKVNMMDYDDPFYITVENLIKLKFNREQQNLINWWLYDKFLPTGETLILTDKKTEDVIPTDTPEEIWDLIIDIKKRNEKKNPK